MSDKEGHENNTNTQQGIQDRELNESNFLALQKQMLKVTKKYDKLIQEVDQLKKQHKAEIEWLKQMIIQIGSHSHALVPSAIPRHEAEAKASLASGYSQEHTYNDNYATKTMELQKTAKFNFAKLPKVIESVSEITTLSPTSCNITLSFSFGPGQADRKLHLDFECENGGYNNKCYYKLKMATVYTETEKTNFIDKGDYFIYICSVKDGKPTDDRIWFQIGTRSKTSKSNYSYNTTFIMNTDAIDINLKQEPYIYNKLKAWMTNDASYQLSIIASMSLFVYESLTRKDFTSTPTPSHESKTAKLLDFKSQMNSTVRIHDSTKYYVEEPSPIAKKTLQDSGSPIFNIDFKSEHSFYRHSISFSLSQNAADAYSNWVYGIDTRAFADDIQLNMEVLHFAHEFWICDLIKFCIDNICQILKNNFKLELLVKVWQFEEQHKIRNLDECLLEVIKSKAKMNVDIEGCLPWKN